MRRIKEMPDEKDGRDPRLKGWKRSQMRRILEIPDEKDGRDPR